jgi:hypothetical protein
MIKPVIILAAAVAVISGRNLCLAHLHRRHDEEGHERRGGRAADGLDRRSRPSMSWQAHSQAIGTLRAVRGADLAAQASGVVDQIRFESGSEVAAGASCSSCGPMTTRQTRTAAGHRGARRADLQTRSGAIRRAGDQPGRARYRPVHLEIGARPGDGATGADRRENREGAVRRQARDPADRRGPVSDRGHDRGHAAGARSHLRSISTCRSRRSRISRWDSRPPRPWTPIRAFVSPAPSSPSTPRSMRRAATCRCARRLPTPTGGSFPACMPTWRSPVAPPPHSGHAAADGDHLQPLRRHGLRGAEGRARTMQGNAKSTWCSSASCKLGATRGDQVAWIAASRRATWSCRRADEAAQRHGPSSSTTACSRPRHQRRRRRTNKGGYPT